MITRISGCTILFALQISIAQAIVPEVTDRMDCNVFFPPGKRVQLMVREKNQNQIVPFKLWLQWAINSEKAIRVNVNSLQALKPTLHYLQSRVSSLPQLTIHSDIFQIETSHSTGIDAETFARSVSDLLPTAIISVGWLRRPHNAEDKKCEERYDWPHAFKMISATYEIPQTIVYSFFMPCALVFLEKILWLLTVKANSYARFEEEFRERVLDRQSVEALVNLQRYGLHAGLNASKLHRILHVNPFFKYGIQPNRERRNKNLQNNWKAYNFMHPRQEFSQILYGQREVAMLGWPSGFLFHRGKTDWQRVKGRLEFFNQQMAGDKCQWKHSDHGLLIMIKSESRVPTQPSVKCDVVVKIQANGQISIENQWDANRSKLNNYTVKMTTSTLPSINCYDFEMTDLKSTVELIVYPVNCFDAAPSKWLLWWSSTYYAHTKLILPKVKVTNESRDIYLQKLGDSTVDMLIKDLQFSSAANSVSPIITTFLLLPSIYLYANALYGTDGNLVSL